MQEPKKQVTTLLGELRAGQTDARDRLFALVYEELRQLAGHLMRGERPNHTLEPTDLVNEAVLRLLGPDSLKLAYNRAYFFSAATRAMRQVLVDHARRRATRKRGGAKQRVALDSVLAGCYERNIDIIALDEALVELARLNERQSEIVSLRFFAGLTMKAIAEQLGVSVATVENDFRVARAWLRGQLGGSEG